MSDSALCYAAKIKDAFAAAVVNFYHCAGRKDLPWQQPATPYRVWISEIMLQQTQVTTVIPYFQRFMARFPDVQSLADAEADEVMQLWAGLGYYSRARNLHRCAQQLMEKFGGELPADVPALTQLPGIGRSTAGAIVSLGFGRPAPILDGNVKRVLSRVFCIDGWSGHSAVSKRLWQLSETLTPQAHCGHFNQAMMDIGATICSRRNPDCATCPLSQYCQALQTGKVASYPQPKPKKLRPVKTFNFLLLQDRQRRILLERRTHKSIWGGLWCLPQIDDNLRKDAAPLYSTLHQLTHFTMQIRIYSVDALAASHQVEATERQVWHNFQSIKRLGLAKPMQTFINELYKNTSTTKGAHEWSIVKS